MFHVSWFHAKSVIVTKSSLMYLHLYLANVTCTGDVKIWIIHNCTGLLMPGVCSREKCSRSAFKFDYVGFSENDLSDYIWVPWIMQGVVHLCQLSIMRCVDGGQYVMVDCCYCYCCCWVDEWLLCGLVECSSSGRGVNSQWRVAGGTEQGLEWQCCCCGWTHFHILKNLSRKHSPTWNGNTDATRTLLDTLSHSQKLV